MQGLLRGARPMILQDREFAALLAEYALISYGTTQQWNATGSTGKPGSRILYMHQLDSEPHRPTYWAREYENARSDIDRDRVITLMRQEIEQWKRRPKGIKYREPSWQQTRDEIAEEGRGDSPEVVALAKRTSAGTVRKARRQLGLNPETGYALVPVRVGPGCGLSVEERRVVVRELVSGGLSVTAVAHRLGVGYNTVRRDLGRAA